MNFPISVFMACEIPGKAADKLLFVFRWLMAAIPGFNKNIRYRLEPYGTKYIRESIFQRIGTAFRQANTCARPVQYFT